MRQRHLTLAIIFALLTSLCSWADPAEYIHPKKDVLSGTCTVTDEGVTYHSMDYPKTPPTYYGGYVRFTAENEGDPVSISFTDFNCTRNGKPIVFVYDGEDALKTQFTGYSKDVPAGYLAAVSADNIGTEYTADSGVLCVLYAPASKSEFVTSPSGTISGTYTASVSAGVAKDMEFTGASAGNSGTSAWRGARSATLLTVTVNTEGKLNPLALDALDIDISATASCGAVENIRLLAGSEVIATAQSGTATLKASATALKGRNTYTVVADVLPDASGTIPAPTVAALSVGGVSRSVESTGSDIAIANSIRMGEGTEGLVYTISDETSFYDAGGSEGVIPLYSEGYVTFVPATEDMRVQIDFSSLSIFDTSSVGYNDILNVYNGREAIVDNLIAEVKTAGVVRSTASDGSLTVYFKSTQGNASQCRPGWEATVTEYTPTQMTLSGADATSSVSGELQAGTEGAQLFIVNVRTKDQLDPLLLEGISISASDAALFSNVSVYALGSTPAFSTQEVYGTGTWSGNTLTVCGDRTLAEGDNYFGIAADIAENAADGTEATVSVTSATVSGSQTAFSGETSASVDIDNTCRLDAGTHSHRMYGDWKFINAPASEYSSNYAPGTSDCIVTFYPQTAGTKAQIEFESFEVYYASTSYGTKAVFEVYSGDGTDAGNLLWKLSDNSMQTTGPGRKLRSQAPDGAITVKFNPSTSSSYYCAKGWKATVTQFLDHDATVTGTTVAQASTAILAPGSTDERLIDIDVITEGTLNPLSVASFDLSVKGSEAISAVKIYRGETFDTATLWGEAVPASDNAVLTVSHNGESSDSALEEEHNRFFVTVDIKDAVESDIEVDAALRTIGLGATTYTVTDGDPEGVRLTKNIYICQSGTHTVTVGRPIVFYDEGGPEGDITKNFSATITFVPASPDRVLSLSASQFGLGTGRMVIYSGHEAIEANILGKSYYNGTSGPAGLLSKAEDGSITVVYTTQSYSSGSGFAIDIVPLAAEPFAISTVSVEAASDIDVVRGSQDAPIAKVAVTVEGTKGTLDIDRVAVDFSGSTSTSDIEAARLYYTGTIDGFSTTAAVSDKTALADDGSAVFTPAEPVSINEAGTYYFWVGADLGSTVEPGNVASVTVTAVGDYTVAESPAASRTIVSGMGGTYRVGPSAEARFKTIAAAVQSLSLGVEAPVVFELEDGTYAENVYIADVAGTSEAHPVTFTSLSGQRDKVIIAGAASDSNRGAVTVANSSHIRFSGISISPAQSGFLASVLYTDGSRGGVIDDCIVRSEILTNVTSGPSVIRTSAGKDANTNCDNFTVSNSYIDGGYIAVYCGGSGTVANPKDSGLRLIGNTVTNACSKGMYIFDCENFTIEGNTVTAGANARKSYNGMDVYRPTGSYTISRNRITNNLPVDNTGIYLRMSGGSADATRPAMITNNVIAINAAIAYTYGMMFETTQTNVLIAHNTIKVDGASTLGSCYAISILGKATEDGGVRLLNNILLNSTKAGALRTAYDVIYTNVTFGGNVYYGNDDIIDGDGNTFAEYQTATGDDTSVWMQPDFASDADLHLASADDAMLRERLDAVTTDADGKDRNESTPAGAYEYTPLATGKPEIAEGYPAIGAVSASEATVNTRWTIGGILYSAIFKTTDEAPDSETLLAGQGVQVDADATVPTIFKGLDELTAYRAAFMVVSALGEASDVVLSAEFTTEKTIYPLTLDMDWDDEAVNAAETIIIEPIIEGGKEPLTYLWTDKNGEECGSDATLTLTATKSDTYRLTVTSADGQRATGKAHVPVITDAITIADFEDLAMPDAGWWKYDAENDEDTYTDSFFSGSFRFPNYPMISYDAWCGYGYACETETAFENLDHQFRNAVGGGAEGTASYGVAYLYGANATITVGHGDDCHNVHGVYVTNSAYTLSVILNGNALCPKFTAENDDYMTATFTGYDADGNTTGSVDVVLADYRSRAAEPEILTKWKWVDLSSLGNVNTLRLTYDSSQRSYVPAYVCIDRLGRTNPDGPDETGVESLRTGGDIRITRPTPDCLSVLGAEGRYRLDIYSTGGTLRASHQLEGAATVGIGELGSGMYIATVCTEDAAPVSAKIAVR